MINMKTANLHIYLISHNNYINRRNDLAINLVHTHITHEAIHSESYTSAQQELEIEAQAHHEHVIQHTHVMAPGDRLDSALC